MISLLLLFRIHYFLYTSRTRHTRVDYFRDTDHIWYIPEKIQDFLDRYADRQKVFDSILLNKLEGFFSDLQWSLDLNPYTNALSSFEI